MRIFFIFFLGNLIVLLLFPVLQQCIEIPKSQKSTKVIPLSSSFLASEVIGTEITLSRRNAIVQTVEKVAPAVVSVNTTFIKEYQVQYPEIFRGFFPYPEIYKEKIPGIGSGFVIRDDGYILTNSHVVEGAREIFVTFADGRRFDAIDVLVDRQFDLAVIQIDAENLPVVELGNSDSVIIGEWAIAIGNPFGLMIEDPKPTVTVGVISAVNRRFRPEGDGHIYRKMIQTDASINPGNSGGPLVNSDGEVIGVNTFIFSKSGGSLGIGFALPINQASNISSHLIEQGNRGSWTGIEISNLNPRLSRILGLVTTYGALITEIEANSPGSKAGLSPGDVIVALNGSRVRSTDDIIETFREARSGDAFNLLIHRGPILIETQMVLEPDPRSP